VVESYIFRDGWNIEDHAAYHVEDEVRKATIFALANGYMSSRGAPESASLAAPGIVGHHINGLYDSPDGDILKREIINLPAWTPLHLEVNGERLDHTDGTLKSYTRSLDMRRGRLEQEAAWVAAGAAITLHSERLVSMARPHLAAICWQFQADADCSITLRSAIDARITNRFAGSHFSRVDVQGSDSGGAVTVTTVEQAQRVTVMAAHRIEGVNADSHTDADEHSVQTAWAFPLRAGQPVTLTKLVAVYDSRFSTGDLAALCRAELESAQQAGYDALRDEHAQRWGDLWATSDVVIEGDDEAQMALRFCLFHLLANLPTATR
jgi:kojibiose phosphorylase